MTSSNGLIWLMFANQGGLWLILGMNMDDQQLNRRTESTVTNQQPWADVPTVELVEGHLRDVNSQE